MNRSPPTAPPPLILVGGGGHALVVAEAAALLGHRVLGFLDDNPRAVLAHGDPCAPCLGPLRDLSRIAGQLASEPDWRWIVAIGDTGVRRRALRALAPFDDRATTVIHPTAIVSPTASIAHGCFVGPRAVVHTRARVAAHAIINTGCVVEHECEVGENVHCAPGSILGGRTRVGRDTLVGIGAQSLPGARIGSDSIVGAGALVLKHVPDSVVAVGVPARSSPRAAQG